MLERSKKEVIDTLIETEDKLSETNTVILGLEEKLQEALNQIQRYRGRIDQLMGREEEIIHELRPIGIEQSSEPLPETFAASTSPEVSAEADLFVSMVDRGVQADRDMPKNDSDDGGQEKPIDTA